MTIDPGPTDLTAFLVQIRAVVVITIIFVVIAIVSALWRASESNSRLETIRQQAEHDRGTLLKNQDAILQVLRRLEARK